MRKSIFQVHDEDAEGNVILQKRLRRSQAKLAPARIGIEACGSAQPLGSDDAGAGPRGAG